MRGVERCADDVGYAWCGTDVSPSVDAQLEGLSAGSLLTVHAVEPTGPGLHQSNNNSASGVLITCW